MGNELVVDVNTIEGLAGRFAAYRVDLDTAKGKVSGLTIEAGDFQDATDLEKVVAERATQLTKNVTGLAETFKLIEDKLVDAAKKYKTTQEQNNITASEFDDLVTSIEGKLPGFGDD